MFRGATIKDQRKLFYTIPMGIHPYGLLSVARIIKGDKDCVSCDQFIEHTFPDLSKLSSTETFHKLKGVSINLPSVLCLTTEVQHDRGCPGTGALQGPTKSIWLTWWEKRNFELECLKKIFECMWEQNKTAYMQLTGCLGFMLFANNQYFCYTKKAWKTSKLLLITYEFHCNYKDVYRYIGTVKG